MHPQGMASSVAGRIADGLFYPYGSVSFWFFQKQREFDEQARLKAIQVYVVGVGPGQPVKIGMSCDP